MIRGALAICLALAVTPAAAQVPEDLARLEEAQRFILEGRAHFEAGRYPEGIAAYEQAYAAFPDPRQLFVIAAAHERTAQRCAAAPPAWDRYLEACADCDDTEVARARRRSLVETCPVSVQITSEPGEALIEIDGRPVGSTPIEVHLPPGVHVVAAELEALPRLRTEVTVEPGLALLLPLRFGEPVRPVPQPQRALIDGPDNTWAWVAYGVGGVGATLGVVFLAQMLESIDDFEGARSRAIALDAREDAQRRAVLTQVGFGVALVGVAAGLLLWESDGPSVVVGPGRIGAVVRF